MVQNLKASKHRFALVNSQNVAFFIVTACNFVACTDASKENAVPVIVTLKMESHFVSEILITTCNATQCYNPKCFSLGFSLLNAPNESLFFLILFIWYAAVVTGERWHCCFILTRSQVHILHRTPVAVAKIYRDLLFLAANSDPG